MGTLAVIGLFYRRWENTPGLMARVLIESSRIPDEFWVMCEDEDDAAVARDWAAAHPSDLGPLRIQVVATPRVAGQYAVVPYSLKTNRALDRATADFVAYLTNDSMPDPDKYRAMAEALDEHPDWGAVYCGQTRNGTAVPTSGPVHDAACVLDHTQVMHRRCDARWSLDMERIRLGDAWFWRELHARFGPIQPVDRVLDATWLMSDGISVNF